VAADSATIERKIVPFAPSITPVTSRRTARPVVAARRGGEASPPPSV
jgi:hypothetical protein